MAFVLIHKLKLLKNNPGNLSTTRQWKTTIPLWCRVYHDGCLLTFEFPDSNSSEVQYSRPLQRQKVPHLTRKSHNLTKTTSTTLSAQGLNNQECMCQWQCVFHTCTLQGDDIFEVSSTCCLLHELRTFYDDRQTKLHSDSNTSLLAEVIINLSVFKSMNQERLSMPWTENKHI